MTVLQIHLFMQPYLLFDRFVDLCSNLFIYFDRLVCINFKRFTICLGLIVTHSFFLGRVLCDESTFCTFSLNLAESIYFIFHLCICFIN